MSLLTTFVYVALVLSPIVIGATIIVIRFAELMDSMNRDLAATRRTLDALDDKLEKLSAE